MSRIESLRRILDTRTAGKVDGTTLDLTTASMLVTVYDALDRPGGLFERNPGARDKFDRIPLLRLIDFGWKNVR